MHDFSQKNFPLPTLLLLTSDPFCACFSCSFRFTFKPPINPLVFQNQKVTGHQPIQMPSRIQMGACISSRAAVVTGEEGYEHGQKCSTQLNNCDDNEQYSPTTTNGAITQKDDKTKQLPVS